MLDVAAALEPHGLDRLVERSETLELFDLGDVQRTIERHPNHPGARGLTRAIGLYRDDEPTRSALEAMFLAL